MVDSLRHKIIRALSWSLLEAVAQRGVQFITGIILARLLFPEQFGLIGMLIIFTAVAQSFIDGGFGAALIQKRETTETDICSVFYFNIFMGFVTAGLLCLGAPFIATFFEKPILTPLARALSLTIVINSFSLIQNTVLIKRIDFKTKAKVSVIAGTISGIIGITLAVLGYGVWSLAIQQVSASLFTTACLWYFVPWRPTRVFSFNALREMFGFGSRLLVTSILNPIFDNIYLLVIGKLFSPADLGFFMRAQTLNDIPSETLSHVVGRVTFPVFSTVQDDRARLKRGLKKALTTLALVNFPMMIGLAVIASPLVLVLLTEKWAESIPYLQLLCCYGLLFPLHMINLNLLMALGRSDLFLQLYVIKRILLVISIAVTWQWGISAMIYGLIAVSIISCYINSYYTEVLIGYSIWEQVRDLFSYLITAAIMGMAVYAAGSLLFPNSLAMLFVQIPTGIVVYTCLCRVFRVTAFEEFWEGGWNKMQFLKVETLGQINKQ